MASPEPGYRAGEGSAEQLPRGEAQALNETTNVVPPAELNPDPQPVQDAPGGPSEGTGATETAAAPEEALDPQDEAMMGPASPEDQNPTYEPSSDDEAFIIGPTGRPDEASTAGTMRKSPVSARLRVMTSVLQKAANEPGASPELRQLVDYILRNQ